MSCTQQPYVLDRKTSSSLGKKDVVIIVKISTCPALNARTSITLPHLYFCMGWNESAMRHLDNTSKDLLRDRLQTKPKNLPLAIRLVPRICEFEDTL